MDPEPLLRGRGLTLRRRRGGSAPVPLLQGVDVELGAGESLGVVGRSGAGKSTLALVLALLEPPDEGEVWIEGRAAGPLSAPERRQARRRVQLVFQDPALSLNPRFRCDELVAEPLRVAGWPAARRRERAGELMERVGLSPRYSERRPLELSGGQRQRLAVARALAAEPRVLLLDEALSGLDPSIAAQVVELVVGLQQETGLGCVWISHDLGRVAGVTSRLAVLEAGRIVESGPTAKLLSRPSHAATRALLAAETGAGA